jgi:hypothetical protein
MIDFLNKKVYYAFGLNIMSDISLPELSIKFSDEGIVDIVVEFTDLTEMSNELIGPSRNIFIKKNLVMFKIPNTAIYCIENGNKILVSPMENSRIDQIRLYILGSCMGTILLQRRTLPLHGSVVDINGKAYAIVGDSGAGKSTLASAFLKKRYKLLSDDVIPVSLDDNNIPMITPAYPQQKLWRESLDAFGMASNDYRPIFDREMKFAIPVVSQFSSKPLPLAGIFELVKTDEDEIKIMPIQSLQRLHTLFNHTYRNFLIDRLGLREWHFNMAAKIADQIQIYQLQRPMDRFTAHELTSVILYTINNKEVIER